jgi:hypothetical protein
MKTLPLFWLQTRTDVKLIHLYLVSLLFIGAPVSAPGAFISPVVAAGSDGAGAAGAGAGGGGGGGAGSSFLLHPAKARVKAKSVIPDKKVIFFPILSSPPFPSHICGKSNFWLGPFYRTTPGGLQGHRAPSGARKLLQLAVNSVKCRRIDCGETSGVQAPNVSTETVHKLSVIDA